MRRFFYPFWHPLIKDRTPWYLSLGLVFGFVVGSTDLFTIQFPILFLLLFFFRMNLLIALSSALFAAIFVPFWDPLLHAVGRAVLVQTVSLRELWGALYHTPLIPYTRFNHTVVMGTFVFQFLFTVPALVVTYLFFSKQGERISRRIMSSRIGRLYQESPFHRGYEHYLERIK